MLPAAASAAGTVAFPEVAHPEPAVRPVAASAAGTVALPAVAHPEPAVRLEPLLFRQLLILSLQCGPWRHLLMSHLDSVLIARMTDS